MCLVHSQQCRVWLQAQEALAHLAFHPPGLTRSNSEPSLRLMLASPLNAMPQQLFQQPLPTFGGSSTAGALVPYKAPEVRYLLWQSIGPLVPDIHPCGRAAAGSGTNV